MIHRRIESCDQARWWMSVRWENGEKKKKRMPRLQPYYSTTNALIFFFTFTFVLFLFLARYFFYLVSHKLLLRYAYLSNKHRTKSEIKILFSSRSWSLRSTLPAHLDYFLAQYLHSSSSIILRSMNRKRKKISLPIYI